MENKVGPLIRRWRTEHGRTQAEMAALASISVATLERWKRGVTVPHTTAFALFLDKLKVSHEGRQNALSLLDRPDSVKKMSDEAYLLTTGELLEAMRLRYHLSQEQVARCLGVKKSTVCRWEKSGSLPDVERLPHIYDLFHASSEERAALDCRRSRLIPPMHERAMSLEECEHRLNTFIDAMSHSQFFAGEPGFILLEARLLKIAETNQNARRLLAMTWTRHAEFLTWRHRIEKANVLAGRALDIVKGQFTPEPFWMLAVDIRVQRVAGWDQDGPEAAYAQLREYVELAQQVGTDICVYRNLAGHAAAAGWRDEARTLFQKSRQIAERREQAWGIQLANIEEAEMNLRSGHANGQTR